MSALYPDVPLDIGGVPPVLRSALALAEGGLALLRADTGSLGTDNQWGIFDQSGALVLEPDTIVSTEFGGEYRISDYPIEGGGFESYNKVAVPFEVRVAMSKGGTLAEREQFMVAVEQIRASLDLYDVATPDHVYIGVNVTRVIQSRSPQSGAGMANVELILQEIRQTASVSYSIDQTEQPATQAAPIPARKPPPLRPGTTKQAAAVRPVNGGAVQLKKPPSLNAPNGAVAQVVTTSNGRQLYVYDKPPGK